MKYCNQCGSTMPDNVFFCANCGATLGGANLNNGYTRPDQPYMPPNAMPQAYVPVQPEPVRTGGNLPASEQSEFFNQNGFGQPPISAYAPAYAQPDNIAEPAAAHAGSLPSLQTFDDFYELVASKKTKSFYRWLGVLCVLNVVLNLAYAFVVPYSLVDAAVFIILSVLVFTEKSPVVPIVLSVMGCISFVISLVLSSASTGIIFTIYAIFSAVRLKRIKNAYVQYKQTGAFPPEQI